MSVSSASRPIRCGNPRRSALLLEGLNELTRYHYEKSPRIRPDPRRGLGRAENLWLDRRCSLSAGQPVQGNGAEEHRACPRWSCARAARPDSEQAASSSTTRRRGVSRKRLVASFRPILGSRRLPFLAIDTKDVIKPTDLTARGGGVLGMMKFGAKTAFALDAQLDLDKELVETFVRANGARAVSHFRLHLSRLGQALPRLRRWRDRPFERDPHPLGRLEKARGAEGLQRRVPGRAQAPVQSDATFSTSMASSSRSAPSSSKARTDCSIRPTSPTSS